MRTILILDDDRVFRRLLVDALQKRGHRVLEAGRAAEADLLLSSEQPDLLLVDGLLPDTTGVEWIKKLRGAGRATPVLFVTSFWKSMRDFEIVTRTLGATQLIRKTALPKEIADRVDSLLGIPGPESVEQK
jgi:two-component system, OmpR family, phosphate regulon response regulator PhoB